MVNVGVAKLARELGIAASSVSDRMARGQSADFIRDDVLRRKKALDNGEPTPPSGRNLVRPVVRDGGEKGGGASPVDKPRSYGARRIGKVGASISAPASIIESDFLPTDPHLPEDISEEDPYEGRSAAELRKIKAQASYQELKVKQLNSELVTAVHVNFVIGSGHARMKDRLFRIPAETRDELALCDDPIECERIVRDAINGAVGELRLLLITGGMNGAGAGNGNGSTSMSISKNPDEEEEED